MQLLFSGYHLVHFENLDRGTLGKSQGGTRNVGLNEEAVRGFLSRALERKVIPDITPSNKRRILTTKYTKKHERN